MQRRQRLRDRAIVLLLARLGPRASEVANLKIADIDFRNGRLRVLAGKSRHAEWLPLTQEVGDAIIAYLQRARPNVRTARLFVTEFAPLRPVTRITVKCIVNRTLDRAGIESPHRGAHVLRHSAETAMLRHGVSLTGVGAVLRPPPGALPDADEISQSITTALGQNYTLQFALMDESNSVLDQFQVTFGAFSDTINGTDPLLEGHMRCFHSRSPVQASPNLWISKAQTPLLPGISTMCRSMYRCRPEIGSA